MTPSYPKPSVHDVVIGKFDANAADNDDGIFANKWGVVRVAGKVKAL